MYGDPLVLTKAFGKGQTVVFLTTAGKKWNDWAGGGMASPTWPIVMLSLQRYLTSATDESSRTLGTPLDIALDADSYEDHAKISFQPAPGEEKEGGVLPANADASVRELETIAGKEEGKQLHFSFASTRKPGVYYVKHQGQGEGQATRRSRPRTTRRSSTTSIPRTRGT